jgi:hypothetical protein
LESSRYKERIHSCCTQFRIFSFLLLSENKAIKICKIANLSLFLDKCRIWFHTLGEEERFICWRRMLREAFGLKRNRKQRTGENCIIGEFVCYAVPDICTIIKLEVDEMGGPCNTHERYERGIHFSLEN